MLGGQQALHAAERLYARQRRRNRLAGGRVERSRRRDDHPRTPHASRPPISPRSGSAPSNLIEFASGDYPEAILPRQVREGTNVASQVFDFGGSITAPSVADIEGEEKRKIPRKSHHRGPDRAGFGAQGQQRSRNHCQHRPRDSHRRPQQYASFLATRCFPTLPRRSSRTFLRKFRIRVNDGLNLTDAGNPIWEEFLVENDNVDPVTTIPLEPPRLLRFVRLEAISGISFELEKVQIFGEGFLPAARYVLAHHRHEGRHQLGADSAGIKVAIGNEEAARVEDPHPDPAAISHPLYIPSNKWAEGTPRKSQPPSQIPSNR